MMIKQTAPLVRPTCPDGRREYRCARCGSSAAWEECYNCNEGYSSHDCGDDTCCCPDPEDNVRCDICRGHGGWYQCLSTPEWCEANPLPGRDFKRGQIEWFKTE